MTHQGFARQSPVLVFWTCQQCYYLGTVGAQQIIPDYWKIRQVAKSVCKHHLGLWLSMEHNSMACFETHRIIQVKKMCYVFIEILFSNVITAKSFHKNIHFFILIFPLDSKRTTSEMFLKVLRDKIFQNPSLFLFATQQGHATFPKQSKLKTAPYCDYIRCSEIQISVPDTIIFQLNRSNKIFLNLNSYFIMRTIHNFTELFLSPAFIHWLLLRSFKTKTSQGFFFSYCFWHILLFYDQRKNLLPLYLRKSMLKGIICTIHNYNSRRKHYQWNHFQ